MTPNQCKFFKDKLISNLINCSECQGPRGLHKYFKLFEKKSFCFYFFVIIFIISILFDCNLLSVGFRVFIHQKKSLRHQRDSEIGFIVLFAVFIQNKNRYLGFSQQNLIRYTDIVPERIIKIPHHPGESGFHGKTLLKIGKFFKNGNIETLFITFFARFLQCFLGAKIHYTSFGSLRALL